MALHVVHPPRIRSSRTRGWPDILKPAGMLSLLKILPKATMTRLGGRVMASRWSRPWIPRFCRQYGVDWREAALPPEQYQSIQEFFCRALKPGVRPIDPDPLSLISPVDATVAQAGSIHDGTLLQAKGLTYTVADLLVDHKEARRYEGGWYATLYLSPRDYHRIHAPAEGTVRECTYVPGSLWPVNRKAVGRLPRLFVRNERLITYLDTPAFGRVAIVKVGACMVGGIRVTYDAGLRATHQRGPAEHRCYPHPHAITKGEELGRFEFGSTVILLAEPGRWNLSGSLRPDAPVRVGQPLAHAETTSAGSTAQG